MISARILALSQKSVHHRRIALQLRPRQQSGETETGENIFRRTMRRLHVCFRAISSSRGLSLKCVCSTAVNERTRNHALMPIVAIVGLGSWSHLARKCLIMSKFGIFIVFVDIASLLITWRSGRQRNTVSLIFNQILQFLAFLKMKTKTWECEEVSSSWESTNVQNSMAYDSNEFNVFFIIFISSCKSFNVTLESHLHDETIWKIQFFDFRL